MTNHIKSRYCIRDAKQHGSLCSEIRGQLLDDLVTYNELSVRLSTRLVEWLCLVGLPTQDDHFLMRVCNLSSRSAGEKVTVIRGIPFGSA